MTKLEKNYSIISCAVAAFDLDREMVVNFFKKLIAEKRETFKMSEIADVSTTSLGCPKKKYWAKDGSVMRRISIKTFLKTYPKGRYLITLDKEMVYVKDGFMTIGRVGERSAVNHILKIN